MSFRNAGNPLCWTDQQRGFPVFTKQTEGNRLIICLLICSCIVYLTFSCHNITFEIFVISRNLVYHASIRKKLDDAVRSCLYDLRSRQANRMTPGNLIIPLFNAVMDSISRWSVGSSKIKTLLPMIIMRERRTRTFSPPERTRIFFTPSSPAKSIRPRKPRT